MLLIKKFYGKISDYIKKNGLPFTGILIYLPLSLLVLKEEPFWGTIALIFIAGLFYFSWWVTKNENSLQD